VESPIVMHINSWFPVNNFHALLNSSIPKLYMYTYTSIATCKLSFHLNVWFSRSIQWNPWQNIKGKKCSTILNDAKWSEVCYFVWGWL